MAIMGLSHQQLEFMGGNQQVEVGLGSVTVPLSDLLAECVLLSTTLAPAVNLLVHREGKLLPDDAGSY